MSEHGNSQLTKQLQELYINKKYDDAISLMLTEKKTFDAGQFHFNLGSLYIKQNNFPPAKFNLKKSIKSGGFIPGAFHNLNFIESKIQAEKSDASFWVLTDFILGTYASLSGLLGENRALTVWQAPYQHELATDKSRKRSSYLMAVTERRF